MSDYPQVGGDEWVAWCQRIVHAAGGQAQVEQLAERCDPDELTHDEVKAIAALGWLQTVGLPVQAQ